MIELLHRLHSFFDRADDWRLGGLLLLVFFGALVETVGVALIPAFVALLNSPADVLSHLQGTPAASLVAERSHQSIIFAASAVLAVFFLLKNAFLLLVVHLQARFVSDQQAKLAERLLGSYLHKPYTFHLQRNTSELLRNVNTGVVNIFLGVFIPTFVFVAEVAVVISVALLLVLVEPISSLIAVATIGFTGFLYYRLIRAKVAHYGRYQQHHSSEMVKWVNQGLGGIKEAKVLGREAFFLDAYRQNVVAYARASRLLQTVNQTPRYLIETVAMVGMMAVIVVMILGGRQIETVLPSLALFAIAALRVMPSMNRIVGAANSIRYYRPAVDAVYADLGGGTTSNGERARPGADPDPLPFTSGVEIRGVSYRYPGAEAEGLRDVSLGIPKGSSVALVGPSGAGKTTLVDVILGLLPPSSGVVLMDGCNVHEFLAAWQSKVGYIPQSIYLCDDSIRRNVAFGVPDDQVRDDEIWRALEAAQLAGLVRSLPAQLDTLVGERGVRLSGGQRQRIGIARALYHQPEILVMDEATAALDHRTEREITEVLDALRGSKTMIVIAHRISTVRGCDTLFYMRDGQVVRSGSYEELLDTYEDFQLMVG